MPIESAPTVRLDERAPADAPWVVVLDAHDRPLGWVEPHRLDGPVTSPVVHRGSTVGRADGPLRGLLDAALSSPAGLGLVADDDGRFLGTVRPEAVLAAIEGARLRREAAS